MRLGLHNRPNDCVESGFIENSSARNWGTPRSNKAKCVGPNNDPEQTTGSVRNVCKKKEIEEQETVAIIGNGHLSLFMVAKWCILTPWFILWRCGVILFGVSFHPYIQ